MASEMAHPEARIKFTSSKRPFKVSSADLKRGLPVYTPTRFLPPKHRERARASNLRYRDNFEAIPSVDEQASTKAGCQNAPCLPPKKNHSAIECRINTQHAEPELVRTVPPASRKPSPPPTVQLFAFQGPHGNRQLLTPLSRTSVKHSWTVVEYQQEVGVAIDDPNDCQPAKCISKPVTDHKLAVLDTFSFDEVEAEQDSPPLFLSQESQPLEDHICSGRRGAQESSIGLSRHLDADTQSVLEERGNEVNHFYHQEDEEQDDQQDGGSEQ